MSQLPPDPERLRLILEWLDGQIAHNDTVATYLKVQHATVTEALARAEGEQQPTEQPAPAPSRRPPRPTFTGDRRPAFKVVERGGENEPPRLTLHIGACEIDDGPAHQINAHDALAALREGLDACAVCRPDIDLSFDD
ncbi:DUF6233 domain-containing protein [Streptomyces sp. NPDC055722]